VVLLDFFGYDSSHRHPESEKLVATIHAVLMDQK
jgi:hypothetical protein